MNYTKKSFSVPMTGLKFADHWDQTFGKKTPTVEIADLPGEAQEQEQIFGKQLADYLRRMGIVVVAQGRKEEDGNE